MKELLFIAIFRLNGAYVGVLTSDGWFFDAEGRYIGWYDDEGQVWYRDGSLLGEILNENYILTRQGRRPFVRRTPRVPPVTPELPAAPADRIPTTGEPGWVDALDNILCHPTADEMVGQWNFQEGSIQFGDDRQFTLSVHGRAPERGVWKLRGNLILTPRPQDGEQPPNVVYRIVEYVPGRIVLRWLTRQGRSLPFTMHRQTDE